MPRRQGNPLFGMFLLFIPFIIMIISKKRVIHKQPQRQQQPQQQPHRQQQQNNDTLQEQHHNITKINKSKINEDFMKMGEWNKIIQEPERVPAFCYEDFVIPERKKSHLYALVQ